MVGCLYQFETCKTCSESGKMCGCSFYSAYINDQSISLTEEKEKLRLCENHFICFLIHQTVAVLS